MLNVEYRKSNQILIAGEGLIVQTNEPAWYFQQCGMFDQQRLRQACAYAQSDQSLCKSLEYSMTIKLLTENYLEFPSLIGGCTGSSESSLGKMPHCWKSHVAAQMRLIIFVSFTDMQLLSALF